MKKATATEADVVRFRQDVQVKLRGRDLPGGDRDRVLEEELTEALRCASHERCERRRG